MYSFNYNGNIIPIEIIRKSNKNSYIRVKDNTIVVTTNYLMSDREVSKLVNINKEFIIKCLDKSEIKEEKSKEFRLFGHTYDIVFGFPNTEIDEKRIYTKDDKTLNKYINNYIYDVYKERLDYWYNRYEENIPTPNLKIRKMTSRWGVCNINNHNVTLNLELSKYKIECLDYVIVHELSHFIHPNHSKEFWNQVSKYYPNWKDIRKYLRENG